MTDDIWVRNEVQSPCVKICAIHPLERICTGCLRTIEEITAWGKMSESERTSLILELPKRQSNLTHRRGGRRARLKLLQEGPDFEIEKK
ncbi:MAG: DUF1289 domain-containing protein [Rhodobacteraceae bacterium]|jgi:hypothetical protein|nr:DUF1289 domain-containing protein [Paracoccaceae bacterium]MBT4284296.1 DUF1289 domain-containing protein [Paracoccaceae bacterium]MBT4778355.1 DUF1289 domain-containing protein [Paracoccaceae bacterium]MBT6270730.1 DUF1289 domain-containing protein [Paracoccaceae bacterium]MBT6436413.1 DUF1289 domain-containing protein [Paracoccaceae bacterium]|tara:strand:+ start:551 stop:817 length:267 start_codon:yes stop_codon:yes gene_type:complete